MTRISQKIRLEGLKTRLRNFPRNILSPKAERGREREMTLTLTLTLTLRMTGTISTVQSVMPKEGHSGLMILKTAELLRDSRKRNKGQLMV